MHIHREVLTHNQENLAALRELKLLYLQSRRSAKFKKATIGENL